MIRERPTGITFISSSKSPDALITGARSSFKLSTKAIFILPTYLVVVKLWGEV
jgi:hypothetical protein